MIEDANRLAYLNAMEIDVWRERGAQHTGDAPDVPEETLSEAADIPLLDWEQLRQRVE